MPMMKAPYTHQIISTTGHSVEFEANEPTWVPEVPQLIEECQLRGAAIVDEPMPEPEVVEPAPAAPPEKVDNKHDAEAEFAVGLDMALMAILKRNDPADLKADLFPKLNKVVAEMSPDLRRPNATEVSDAYQRLQENISLAE